MQGKITDLTDTYSDLFVKNIKHFNKVYYNGFTNAPLHVKLIKQNECAITKATISLKQTLYGVFASLSEVILQHGK